MAIQVDYPGVYIQELPVNGPIEGVGTSTAAFLGPSRNGEPNRPTLITSFDDFLRQYDSRPLNGRYLWHAARGFFQNNGRKAYIVRVTNGAYGTVELLDSTAQPALVVRSRQLGPTSITVTVMHSPYITTTAFRPTVDIGAAVAAGDTKVPVAAPDPLAAAKVAAQFRAGDLVLIADGAGSETAVVRRVAGGDLVLESPLGNAYGAGTVRLANLSGGDRVIRVNSTPDGRKLGPGSVIALQQAAPNPEIAVVASVQTERIRPDFTTYRLELEDPLTSGYDLNPQNVTQIDVISQEFSLSINSGVEEREYLSMARNNARYFGAILAGDPFDLVVVEEPDVPSTAPLPLLRPAEITEPLMGGVADDPTNLTTAEYQSALDALREQDDVNFVAIPDSWTLPGNEGAVVQLALLTHCTEMADRFAIFDPPPTATRDTIGDTVDQLRSERGFGALYFPWIRVPHPETGLLLVPPSGHVAGIYARADNERGVHKAPANYILNGALGVAQDMNNEYQGVLNLDGINVLRVFPDSSRPNVFGARTTSTDTAWQYINIRRLFLFIEESLQEGLRWAVFEPNNLQLWQKLKRTINQFLTQVWRAGALFGATPQEAFYVRIDETNNPPSERESGRLTIEIGLRPSYPAEFIVVQIGLWQGGSESVEG